MTLYETKIARFSTQRNLFYDLDSFSFAYPFQQFQTNIMELEFLEKNFWYHKSRPLIANLHILASNTERHPFQDSKQ